MPVSSPGEILHIYSTLIMTKYLEDRVPAMLAMNLHRIRISVTLSSDASD